MKKSTGGLSPEEAARIDNEVSRISNELLDVLIAEHIKNPDDKLMMMAAGKLVAGLTLEFAVRTNSQRVAILDWLYAYIRTIQHEMVAEIQAKGVKVS